MVAPAKLIEPNATHKAFHADVVTLLRKYQDKLGAEEMLALVSYMVGQIAAMQDQRVMTSEMVMDLVSQNIQIGNASAVKELFKAQGKA